MKPCKENQIRNPKTKRCVKNKKMNLIRNHTFKTTPKLLKMTTITPLEYITLIRLKLRTIATQTDPALLDKLKNKFNNNAIYIVFLTIQKVAALNMDDITAIHHILGDSLLYEHAMKKINRFNTYHNKDELFLPANDFEKLLMFNNVNIEKMPAPIIKNLNVVIDYLMSELYNQILVNDSQSFAKIKKDGEIKHWLSTIGFKELTSNALESNELITAISS